MPDDSLLKLSFILHPSVLGFAHFTGFSRNYPGGIICLEVFCTRYMKKTVQEKHARSDDTVRSADMKAQREAGARALSGILDSLSPERRALLALRLSKKAVSLAQEQATVSEMSANGLVEFLERSSPQSDRQPALIVIQPGDPSLRRAFFCVHPAGGNVFCYAELARHLGSERPFYGFMSALLNHRDAEIPSLKTMAARYVETLRETQPVGPYLLGGWSMGGVVAFEMARQLCAQGQKVALLALFDAKIPDPDERRIKEDEAALLINFAHDLGVSLNRLGISREHLTRLEPDAQLDYLLEKVLASEMIPAHIEVNQFRHLLHVFKTNVRAMCGYMPSVYQGHVKLFKANHQAADDKTDPSMGWNGLAAGGVEVIPLPGTHYTIVREPHVRVLAARLKGCLDEADEK